MPTPSAAYSMLQKHGEKIDRLHKSDLYQVQKSFVIWIFTFLTSKCRWWDPLGRNMSFMLATSLKGVKLESLTFPWQMNAAKKNSSNVWFGGREITSSTGIAGLRSLQPTSKQAKVCNCFSKHVFLTFFTRWQFIGKIKGFEISFEVSHSPKKQFEEKTSRYGFQIFL